MCESEIERLAGTIVARCRGVYRAAGGGVSHHPPGAHPLAAANQYLVDDKPTDPALVQYHEDRALPTGLAEPRAFALASDGTRYVAGDTRVVRLDANGATKTIITLAAPPYCLAVGDGRFYVGLKDHVEVFDDRGVLRSRWAVPGKTPYLTALTVAGNSVWVADAGDRVVWHFSDAGQLIGSLGRRDRHTGAPGFVAPSPHLDLARRDGTLWVANPGRHELEQYAPDGSLRQHWGRPAMRLPTSAGAAIRSISPC